MDKSPGKSSLNKINYLLKLTWPMDKSPGKSFLNKIIN